MMQAKNKKKLKIILSLVIFFFFSVVIYFFFFFELIKIEKDLVVSFYLVGTKNRIEIYSIHSTATTNENIQIIKIDELKKRTTLKVIEDYKLVKEIKILDTNSFVFVLGHNYSMLTTETDSVFVVTVPQMSRITP